MRAVQAADLGKAAGRKNQGGAAQVDVLESRRTSGAVTDPARKGALRSVFAGVFAVRAMTRKWQKHDGKCACGFALETRAHVLWDCPCTLGCRTSQEAGVSHLLRATTGMERELGLPLKDDTVEEWRKTWQPPLVEPAGVWRARHLYADASCSRPWRVFAPLGGLSRTTRDTREVAFCRRGPQLPLVKPELS